MAGPRAVVIGIDYSVAAIDMPAASERGITAEPLAGAEADAQAMAAFLTGRGYAVMTLLGALATGAQIHAALEQQYQRTSGFDTLLLYFAGYGDINAYYQDAAYLLPADADPARLAETALALGDLIGSYLITGQGILLCDCCPSDYALAHTSAAAPHALGTAFEERAARIAARQPRLLSLVHCAANHSGRAHVYRQRGIFTGALLDYWNQRPSPADTDVLRAFLAAPPPPLPPILHPPPGWVTQVAFAPHGRTLASAHLDTTVRLWSAEDGRLRETLTGHSSAVLCLAWAPDETLLASAGMDKQVCLWQIGTGPQPAPATGTRLPDTPARRAVNALAFSPDGRTLAEGSDDKRVWFWNVQQRELLRGSFTRDPLIYEHQGAVNCLAFSPDGSLLAAGDDSRRVEVWRTAQRKHVATLAEHGRVVSSVAFAPNGRLLASASDAVRLWWVHDMSLAATLAGHTGNVESVDFSPDGRVLASAGTDTTIRLWRVSDGALLATFIGHTDAIWCIDFSPDGRLLASASADGTIRFWPLV